MNMAYNDLMIVHLATVIPCFVIGTTLLLVRKGTSFHRTAGRIYMVLMLFTACITLLMPAQVGPRFLDHFGYLHGFSFLTIYTVPTAYIAIKRGNVKAHRRKMILLYVGAILIAGGFTLLPGRYLYEIFFG